MAKQNYIIKGTRLDGEVGYVSHFTDKYGGTSTNFQLIPKKSADVFPQERAEKIFATAQHHLPATKFEMIAVEAPHD